MATDHDLRFVAAFKRSLAALDARIAAGLDPRCVTDAQGVQHVAETHLDAFLIQSRSEIPTWQNGGIW
jgi:hypothetical protein